MPRLLYCAASYCERYGAPRMKLVWPLTFSDDVVQGLLRHATLPFTRNPFWVRSPQPPFTITNVSLRAILALAKVPVTHLWMTVEIGHLQVALALETLLHGGTQSNGSPSSSASTASGKSLKSSSVGAGAGSASAFAPFLGAALTSAHLGHFFISAVGSPS